MKREILIQLSANINEWHSFLVQKGVIIQKKEKKNTRVYDNCCNENDKLNYNLGLKGLQQFNLLLKGKARYK